MVLGRRPSQVQLALLLIANSERAGAVSEGPSPSEPRRWRRACLCVNCLTRHTLLANHGADRICQQGSLSEGAQLPGDEVSRSARLLSLLQALRGRRLPVTAARLAEALEVSERTIYRDVADLMAQGAPISGEAGLGYVLRPGLFLPPLMLSEDEVEAVMLGLRYVDQRGDAVLKASAVEALAKIGAVLSPEAQAALEVPQTLPGPSPADFPINVVSLDDLRAAVVSQFPK